jgi:glycosyltransferase involved in cell wall biosynthesis
MKLSVVIPVYNEITTIKELINRVMNVMDIDKEIVIVDDFSTDGTREILKQIQGDNIRVFLHEKNMGKGAAIRTGFKYITGDVVIIQDADLEYNPQDYRKLIKPIADGLADVVYGSRFLAKGQLHHFKKFFYVTHFIGNKFLNFLVNILYNTKITDMETCYKVIKREVLNEINLSSSKFEIEPEITAKLLRKGFKIHEVPICYNPRDYSEGKKISWRDGFKAVNILLKYRFKKIE